MVTDRDRSVVRWVAVIGAASAQDVMAHFRLGRTVCYRRLRALVDHGLLARARFVYGQPALYTATRDGLRWVGIAHGARPSRRRDNAPLGHVRAARSPTRPPGGRRGVGRAAAARRRARSRAADSQRPAWTSARGPAPLRRPDLLLFPDAALPVAFQVELSVKGSRRLEAICRAWARCRIVSEVRYYAPPHVARAVSRAVSSVHADDAIRILSLQDALKEAVNVRFAA